MNMFASVFPSQYVLSDAYMNAFSVFLYIKSTLWGSWSAKGKEKGSTWVMTWNTASWLRDAVFHSQRIYPAFSLSVFLTFLPFWPLRSSGFMGDYLCRSEWRVLLQSLLNVYWHSVNYSPLPQMSLCLCSVCSVVTRKHFEACRSSDPPRVLSKRSILSFISCVFLVFFYSLFSLVKRKHTCKMDVWCHLLEGAVLNLDFMVSHLLSGAFAARIDM